MRRKSTLVAGVSFTYSSCLRAATSVVKLGQLVATAQNLYSRVDEAGGGPLEAPTRLTIETEFVPCRSDLQTFVVDLARETGTCVAIADTCAAPVAEGGAGTAVDESVSTATDVLFVDIARKVPDLVPTAGNGSEHVGALPYALPCPEPACSCAGCGSCAEVTVYGEMPDLLLYATEVARWVDAYSCDVTRRTVMPTVPAEEPQESTAVPLADAEGTTDAIIATAKVAAPETTTVPSESSSPPIAEDASPAPPLAAEAVPAPASAEASSSAASSSSASSSDSDDSSSDTSTARETDSSDSHSSSFPPARLRWSPAYMALSSREIRNPPPQGPRQRVVVWLNAFEETTLPFDLIMGPCAASVAIAISAAARLLQRPPPSWGRLGLPDPKLAFDACREPSPPPLRAPPAPTKRERSASPAPSAASSGHSQTLGPSPPAVGDTEATSPSAPVPTAAPVDRGEDPPKAADAEEGDAEVPPTDAHPACDAASREPTPPPRRRRRRPDPARPTMRGALVNRYVPAHPRFVSLAARMSSSFAQLDATCRSLEICFVEVKASRATDPHGYRISPAEVGLATTLPSSFWLALMRGARSTDPKVQIVMDPMGQLTRGRARLTYHVERQFVGTGGPFDQLPDPSAPRW